MNVKLLTKKIRDGKIKINDLAKKLSIDRSTFYRKLENDGEKFTIKDILILKDYLNLTNEEANSIFFNNFVAQMRQNKQVKL